MMGSEELSNGPTPREALVHNSSCVSEAALRGAFSLNRRFEVNETMGTLTIVAYRNKGTHGNVSVFFYAQNLEAQQGLDYNTSETVIQPSHEDIRAVNPRRAPSRPFSPPLSPLRCSSSSTANDINM